MPSHPPNKASTKTQICTYRSPRAYAKDASRRLQQGWTPQETVALPGHINVARQVVRLALTGGLALLAPPSRQPDYIIVTWVRPA